MCGIVGYIGQNNAVDVLVTGLSRLEYRGYDSVGVALRQDQSWSIVKSMNRVKGLHRDLLDQKMHSNCGIGHTRWATHGGPSIKNAHPHASQSVTLVHNGIIENYLDIKQECVEKGYIFESDTDTEVAAHYLDLCYQETEDFLLAIQKACKGLRGSYAIAAMFKDSKDIYAFREGSPLIVAFDDQGVYVASDVSAIMDYTKSYVQLEPNMIAKCTPDGFEIIDIHTLETLELPFKEALWDHEVEDKGDFEHDMLKEIHDQPRLLRRLIRNYTRDQEPFWKTTNVSESLFENVDRIHIIACGTAYHAGLLGKYWIEKFARIPVDVHVASEFRYQNPILGQQDRVIVISQSGETADTLACLHMVKDKGILTLGIINAEGSSMSRSVDGLILTLAGIEKSVASTKAYFSQSVVLYLLACTFAKKKLSEETLYDIANAVESMIALDTRFDATASAIWELNNAFFVGRGLDYAMAMEGSLKLKEITYVHAEAYPAGELKHGTISLIDKDVWTLAVSTQESTHEKTMSNVQEIRARDGKVFLISPFDIDTSSVDGLIQIPSFDEDLMPLIAIIPLQLLSYKVSVMRGCDVDRPRNLAKSVTVE